MAYAKFTPRNSTVAQSYDVRDMMYSIQDFLQGNDWTVDSKANGSYGFNGSAGTTAGTYPSAGIYYGSSPYGSTLGGELYFYKKHYAHSQFTSAPALKIYLRVSGADGWRIHIYDKNGNNISPNTNTDTGVGGGTTVSYYGVPQSGGDYGYSLEAIHIIANDTTFAIKIVSGGSGGGNTATTQDHGWIVVNDLEYSPTIDLWAHGIDNTYCPTTYTHCAWMNQLGNPTPSGVGSNYGHLGITQPRYIDALGVVRTGTTNPHNATYHSGNYTTYNEQWSTFVPAPCWRQDSFAVAGADTPAHMLTPLTFVGQQRMSLANGTTATDLHKNPRRGRLMNFYRISDEAGNDGDVILEGSTRYRIMKPHMTGDYTMYNANVKACYAFPEDNVPYA